MPKLWIVKTLPLASAAWLCNCGERPASDAPPRAASREWVEMFDGKTLDGWRRLDFDGTGGTVAVEDDVIYFDRGDPFTGLVIANPDFAPPAAEYEIIIRCRKIDGRDFFCALTFPVPEKDSHCTFVAGGWGGGVTGLSNIDHLDANRNTTRAVLRYNTGRWYELRVEVRRDQIRCWVDDRLVTNALITGRRISLRPGAVEACAPLGLASYETSAEFSSLRIRALPPERR